MGSAVRNTHPSDLLCGSDPLTRTQCSKNGIEEASVCQNHMVSFGKHCQL